MTREEYIQKVLAIYKLKYKPTELELKEFELVLQMIPDNGQNLTIPYTPITKPDTNPYPWTTGPLMYGPPIPTTIGPYFSTNITSDHDLTTKEYTDANGLDKGTEEH